MPPPLRLSHWVHNPYIPVEGATQAIHRDVMDTFGPQAEGQLGEDVPMGIRALALDGIFFIDEPMVRHRRHATNIAGYIVTDIAFPGSLQRKAKRYRLWTEGLRQVLLDLPHPVFEKMFGSADIRGVITLCRKQIRRRRLMAEWMASGKAGVRWSLLRLAWNFPPYPIIGTRFMICRLLPGLHNRILDKLAEQFANTNQVP